MAMHAQWHRMMAKKKLDIQTHIGTSNLYSIANISKVSGINLPFKHAIIMLEL